MDLNCAGGPAATAITLSLPDNLQERAESFKILDKEYRWNPNPDTFTI